MLMNLGFNNTKFQCISTQKANEFGIQGLGCDLDIVQREDLISTTKKS